VQYQKLNASYSFFIHKVYLIIRCIKWKQNLGKSDSIQLFPNNSQVLELHECLGRHWKFNLSLPTRVFDLSHTPNPLDTDIIKHKLYACLIWGAPM